MRDADMAMYKAKRSGLCSRCWVPSKVGHDVEVRVSSVYARVCDVSVNIGDSFPAFARQREARVRVDKVDVPGQRLSECVQRLVVICTLYPCVAAYII
jgi:hypothetical protein